LTEPLVAEGAVSEVELLRLKRQVNDLRGGLEATRLAIPRVQSTYDEAIRKVEELELKFRTEARSELNDAISELARISESNQTLEDRVRRTWVKSPVRGTIKQLLVNTVGGVIQPGMDLVAIVPLEDTLLAEAQIRPKDIAFLRPGQEVVVKFTAYDFASYGGLDASLEHISADAINDDKGESFYLVRVRTNFNYLGSEKNPLPLIPGMQTEVNVLTGKKTVLAYLLKRYWRVADVALTER
jgi:adhesin transport system membrane fusion protein